MKAERSDLEGENLGLMQGRFVAFLARESTVLLPCIPLWLGIQIKLCLVRGRPVEFIKDRINM